MKRILAVGVILALSQATTALVTPVIGVSTTPTQSLESGPTPKATEGVLGEEGCQPPLALRERAKTLQTELAERDDGVVSDGTLSDVNTRINHADTSFNLNRYCDAKTAYASAIGIAKSALRRAYLHATRLQVAEVNGMLAAEEADGNPDPDVGPLRERSSRIKEDLRTSESLRERRDLYHRAEQLKTDTREKLPTTLAEQTVEAVVESAFLAIITLLLAIVVAVETYLLFDGHRESGDLPTLSPRGD